MRQQWDGNNYQLYTQALIAICVFCLLIDRFTRPDDGMFFGFAIVLLVTGIFLVPKGPQPPD